MDDSDSTKIIVKIAGGILILILLFMLSPFVIVNAGNRGVVLNFGRIQDTILGEGVHWRVPIMQKVVELEVRTTKLEATASSYSKDTQNVDTYLVVNYHLVQEQVNILYREIGGEYEGRILIPAVQEITKTIVGKYTAQELIEKRQEIKEEIRTILVERMAAKYIAIDDISITDFVFNPEYEAAIERKQVAKQEALTAEANLSKVEFEAEQQVTRARAEAETIRIQAQAITQQGGEDYVQLKAIEKWNGILPTQMIPGGTVPFLDLTN